MEGAQSYLSGDRGRNGRAMGIIMTPIDIKALCDGLRYCSLCGNSGDAGYGNCPRCGGSNSFGRQCASVLEQQAREIERYRKVLSRLVSAASGFERTNNRSSKLVINAYRQKLSDVLPAAREA